MRKTLLILSLGLMAVTAKAGWHYSGFDGKGNWVTGNWDNNGNYSGFDGQGRWITGHMNNGHYSGFDGNGNWVTGQWTPN